MEKYSYEETMDYLKRKNKYLTDLNEFEREQERITAKRYREESKHVLDYVRKYENMLKQRKAKKDDKGTVD